MTDEEGFGPKPLSGLVCSKCGKNNWRCVYGSDPAFLQAPFKQYGTLTCEECKHVEPEKINVVGDCTHHEPLPTIH